MEKWEYKMLIPEVKGFINRKLDPKINEELNTLGDNGWELISVSPLTDVASWGSQTKSFIFIFKRKKHE